MASKIKGESKYDMAARAAAQLSQDGHSRIRSTVSEITGRVMKHKENPVVGLESASSGGVPISRSQAKYLGIEDGDLVSLGNDKALYPVFLVDSFD